MGTDSFITDFRYLFLTENIFLKFFEQKEIWSTLLSSNADSRFQLKIYAFFDEYFAKTEKSKESELKYRFLLYGYSGIFDYWVKSGMKESPTDIAEHLGILRRELTHKP